MFAHVKRCGPAPPRVTLTVLIYWEVSKRLRQHIDGDTNIMKGPAPVARGINMKRRGSERVAVFLYKTETQKDYGVGCE